MLCVKYVTIKILIDKMFKGSVASGSLRSPALGEATSRAALWRSSGEKLTPRVPTTTVSLQQIL